MVEKFTWGHLFKLAELMFGLNNNQVAEFLGVSPSTISRNIRDMHTTPHNCDPPADPYAALFSPNTGATDKQRFETLKNTLKNSCFPDYCRDRDYLSYKNYIQFLINEARTAKLKVNTPTEASGTPQQSSQALKGTATDDESPADKTPQPIADNCGMPLQAGAADRDTRPPTGEQPNSDMQPPPGESAADSTQQSDVESYIMKVLRGEITLYESYPIENATVEVADDDDDDDEALKDGPKFYGQYEYEQPNPFRGKYAAWPATWPHDPEMEAKWGPVRIVDEFRKCIEEYDLESFISINPSNLFPQTKVIDGGSVHNSIKSAVRFVNHMREAIDYMMIDNKNKKIFIDIANFVALLRRHLNYLKENSCNEDLFDNTFILVSKDEQVERKIKDDHAKLLSLYRKIKTQLEISDTSQGNSAVALAPP